jgi:hypothetical protein
MSLCVVGWRVGLAWHVSCRAGGPAAGFSNDDFASLRLHRCWHRIGRIQPSCIALKRDATRISNIPLRRARRGDVTCDLMPHLSDGLDAAVDIQQQIARAFHGAIEQPASGLSGGLAVQRGGVDAFGRHQHAVHMPATLRDGANVVASCKLVKLALRALSLQCKTVESLRSGQWRCEARDCFCC